MASSVDCSGVMYLDIYFYFLHNPTFKYVPEPESAEEVVLHRFTKMLANFAKEGYIYSYKRKFQVSQKLCCIYLWSLHLPVSEIQRQNKTRT